MTDITLILLGIGLIATNVALMMHIQSHR